MTRPTTFLMVPALALSAWSLVAGTALAQSDPSPGYATHPFTPQSFQMPDGAGCTGDVARWQAIQQNDYESGNIGLPIYHKIQGEIAQAAAACAAGHDGQASAMVRTSKARHGYPQ